MAIECDDCCRRIASVEEAYETESGEVLCDDCEAQRARRDLIKNKLDLEIAGFEPEPCSRCGMEVKWRSEKLGEGLLCLSCAHAYELRLFTPTDHDEAQCWLCQHYAGRPVLGRTA